MSVRKRKWITSKGEEREAWVVDYTDMQGDRHVETFAKKKDADARHAEVRVDVRAGVHVAPSKSITVTEAGKSWIRAAEAAELERSTVKQYREHVDQHIVPFIGRVKLSELSAQAVRKFEDRLREEGRSPAMVRKIIGSLGSLLADAQEQGLAAHNAVRDLRRNRRRGKERNAEKRQRGKLKVGVDIPTPDEIKAIIANAKGRWRPLLITAIFTGLRASELRGLRWRTSISRLMNSTSGSAPTGSTRSASPSRRRASAWCPSASSSPTPSRNGSSNAPRARVISCSPTALARSSRLPTSSIAGLIPAQGAKAKYTGLHALRHFYASWCINRPADGGLGYRPRSCKSGWAILDHDDL